MRAKSDNHLIMRVFNVFGGTELGNRHSVIRKLEDGTLEHLFPNWYRDYIHVDEVCRAVLFFLKYRPTGTVDVGTARCLRISAYWVMSWADQHTTVIPVMFSKCLHQTA